MNICLIYSGHLRTWEQCQRNHAMRLRPGPFSVIHYNETGYSLSPYTHDEWGYGDNKAGETWPENSMNMWHNIYKAFHMAPVGLDVYVRMRYDIELEGDVDFTQYEYPPNRVYIPAGGDFREGVNDQFAFGGWDAIEKYVKVYIDHPMHFKAGKMFHTESYLKHTLDHYGVEIVRLPFANRIVR